jgi:hypothetical protein
MVKKKMGRPKLKAGKAKAVIVTVRMAKTERALIGKGAKAIGLGVSEWIRETLLEAARRAIMPIGKDSETEGGGIEPLRRVSGDS